MNNIILTKNKATRNLVFYVRKERDFPLRFAPVDKLLTPLIYFVRKERDSNPRCLSAYTLSKRAH